MGGPAAYQPDVGMDTGTGPTPNPNPPTLGGGPAAYQPDVGMNTPTPSVSVPPPGTAQPGMSGKGGVAGNPAMNLPSQGNIPTPPTMNPPQTGLPGLPVPVAPMTPIGPGLSNPGGPGVMPRPQPMKPPLQPIGTTPNYNKPNYMNNPNQVGVRQSLPTLQQNTTVRGAGRGGMLK